MGTNERLMKFLQASPDVQAEKTFKKLSNSTALLPVLLKAVALQKSTEQWCKDGGQFIPYPATWLTQRRWEDDPASLKGNLHANTTHISPTTSDKYANIGTVI